MLTVVLFPAFDASSLLGHYPVSSREYISTFSRTAVPYCSGLQQSKKRLLDYEGEDTLVFRNVAKLFTK